MSEMMAAKASGLDVRSDVSQRPEEEEGEAASERFEELAASLEALSTRAAALGWSGWSESDSRALHAAAGELRAIPRALARGMKEAFTIGREYGHREEALEELNQEIAALTNHLARQAWGGRRKGADTAGGTPGDRRR